MIIVRRKCKACKQPFFIEKSEPFVTCSKCRRPLDDRAGACTQWNNCPGRGNGEAYRGAEMRNR